MKKQNHKKAMKEFMKRDRLQKARTLKQNIANNELCLKDQQENLKEWEERAEETRNTIRVLEEHIKELKERKI